MHIPINLFLKQVGLYLLKMLIKALTLKMGKLLYLKYLLQLCMMHFALVQLRFSTKLKA